MMKRALIALALAGCGAQELAGMGSDSPAPPQDAQPTSCRPFITFDPDTGIADPDTLARATANLQVSGVPSYTWTVSQAGVPIATMLAQADGSQVVFPTPTPGVIEVGLDVSIAGALCEHASATYNVSTTEPTESFRVRVLAPPAPPQERTVVFATSTPAYDFGAFSIDPGVVAHGAVKAGAVAVPAYLRFIPHGHPDEVVEAFTDASGAFATVRLVDELHDVLAIPTIAGYAPRLVANYDATTTLIAVDAGQTATGTVTGPTGGAIAGAKVQLTIGGVPSTIGTTSATGAFTLAYEPSTTSGAVVAIEVTPPATSGLPRLVGSSTTLSPSAPLAVAYAAALAPRDLAGLEITRAGVALASPTLTVVGSIAAAGTVGTLALAGTVHASVVASAGGIVPALRVPNAPLSAVIAVGPMDVAVADLDLSAAPPAQLDAPVEIPTHLAITIGSQFQPLAGARAIATPIGALADAGGLPITATADAGGALAISLAAGAHYQVHLADPAGGYAGDLADITAATAPPMLVLAQATQLSGTLTQSGSANPVGGAAIQVLCKACDGIDRVRPIAEAASTPAGAFVVSVPAP